jgi:hypothetical protein
MRSERHSQPAVGRKRWWLSTLVSALLAATAAVQAAQLGAPPTPPAPTSREPKRIAPPPEPEPEPILQAPIELLAGRPIVRLMVNGQGPMAFLVDPQAPRVVIDQTLVESLSLKTLAGPAGRGEVRVDIRIGSTSFQGIVAEISNTSRLVPEIGPAGQPRGILNGSLWKDQLFTIDLGRRKLRIDPGALQIPNDKEVFALQASGELLVPLRVSGQSLMCRIDPLASHGLVLPVSYLDQLPIQKPARAVPRIQLRSSTIPGKETRVMTKVTIAAFEFYQPIAEFGEVGDVALLGSRWLLDVALTYDFANGRARLLRVPRDSD